MVGSVGDEYLRRRLHYERTNGREGPLKSRTGIVQKRNRGESEGEPCCGDERRKKS